MPGPAQLSLRITAVAAQGSGCEPPDGLRRTVLTEPERAPDGPGLVSELQLAFQASQQGEFRVDGPQQGAPGSNRQALILDEEQCTFRIRMSATPGSTVVIRNVSRQGRFFNPNGLGVFSLATALQIRTSQGQQSTPSVFSAARPVGSPVPTPRAVMLDAQPLPVISAVTGSDGMVEIIGQLDLRASIFSEGGALRVEGFTMTLGLQ